MDFHAQYDSYYKIDKNGAANFKSFIQESISDRKSLVLVANENKELKGYILAKIALRPPVFPNRKYGAIYDLAVLSKYRNFGIGSKLYKECIKWFRKHKIKSIELTVAVKNPVSTRFWNKHGFKAFTERRIKRI
jgi:ribosomal protein S18 acetylase RimI-like enzyme